MFSRLTPLTLSLTLCFCAHAAAQNRDRARLAFLKGGEVWISESDGQRPVQVTRTRGKVEDFGVAPAGDYLAYTRTVKYVEDDCAGCEPGEKPGKRSVQSIVIVNLATRRTIAELPPEDEWIYIDKWLPGGRLLGHSSSGSDVTDVFEFDVATKQRRNLGFENGDPMIDGDTTFDGSISTYVNDAGLGPTYQQRLHIVDRGTDRIRASKRSIMGPRIAHSKNAVAFVEVTEGGGPSRDRYWVLNLATGDLRLVFDDSVKPKSWGSSGISWSSDDRYLAINYGSVATILDTVSGGKPLAQVQGVDACWLGTTELAVMGSAGIDLYNVSSGARRPLAQKATTPRCFLDTAK